MEIINAEADLFLNTNGTHRSLLIVSLDNGARIDVMLDSDGTLCVGKTCIALDGVEVKFEQFINVNINLEYTT